MDPAPRRPAGRLAGPDLARALAMLAMLVEHTLQYPEVSPKGPLWAVYGRSAPLFVLLAGVGLGLAGGRRGRLGTDGSAVVAARAVLLVVVGMALSTQVDGVILQSFGLFFLVGLVLLRLPRAALAGLAGLCLAGGPLLLTVLRRDGGLVGFGTQDDVGFGALAEPATLLRGLALEHYPAVVWLGFFLLGVVLGRGSLASAAWSRRLFLTSGSAAVALLVVGWAGARAFGPDVGGFALAPPAPTSWSGHWTTYGFSDAVGWTLSSAALAAAVVGGASWLLTSVRGASGAVAPVLALGATSLSFYVLHFLWLDTGWELVQPSTASGPRSLLVSVAFWLAFALLAQQWLRRFPRGPLETVVAAGERALTWPLRARHPPARRVETEPA